MKSLAIDGKEKYIAGQYSNEREYWIKKLAGDLVKSCFPGDNEDPEKKTPHLQSTPIRFPAAMATRLITAGSGSDSMLHMLLAAGSIQLLYKHTGHEDIIIGIPIYKQEEEGDFVNTVLTLRNTLQPHMTFKDLLKQVKQNVIEANLHLNYPVENIPYDLGMFYTREEDFPLFDIIVLLENVHNKKHIRSIHTNMIFSFNRIDEKLQGELLYNTYRYSQPAAERIADYFIYLLGETLDNPSSAITGISVLSAQEKKDLLYGINDTSAGYPREMTIPQLFEKQQQDTPGHIAVIQGDRQITYDKLNRKASRIAAILKEKGAQINTIVAIMGKRSIGTAAGILGILKAGATYLPIDAKDPGERIKFILQDSQAEILITQKHLADFFTNNLFIETLMAESEEQTQPHWENYSQPGDYIYLIYTSGTTGKPKGVLVKHRGVVNYCCWAAKTYVRNQRLNFPLYTSIAFDLTVTSIFTPLITGNAIVVYAGDTDEILIEKVIADNQVGVVKLTPSHMKLIRDQNQGERIPGVKCFILGGEALETQLAKEIYRNYQGNIEIYNEYGPTEASVGCMIHRYDPEKDRGKYVPIGLPADNTQVFILNNEMQPLPVGTEGEIYISGDGIAAGYISRPGLTAQRFIPNPFFPGKTMYKTGDMGRRLEERKFEFTRRKDNQVKIRGYRVEIDGITDCLAQHSDIKDAVVTARQDQSGDNYLCAYIVTEKEIPGSQLREYLAGQLPGYMIPSYFVRIEHIPLTRNAKLDLAALPDPATAAAKQGENQGPGTELECKLVDIWSEVLEIAESNLGIDVNFFEVGGHSLKASTAIIRINNAMGVNLPLSFIFDSPTIAEFARALSQRGKEKELKIAACPPANYYDLSHAQKRLWFFTQMEPDNPAYNIGLNVLISGPLETRHLRTALTQLQQRHESLRTSIQTQDDGTPVQIIHKTHEIDLEIMEQDISHLPPEQKQQELKNLLHRQGIKIFELARAPLFRVGLIKLNQHRYAMALVMHHIISDGWSVQVIIEEIAYFYNRAPGKEQPAGQPGEPGLPPLTIQYKDFAQWQNQLLTEEQGWLKTHSDYWHEKLAGELPVLDLPPDFPRPARQSPWGDKIIFFIEEDLTQKLGKLAAQEVATLFMVLTAAFKVLLYRCTGQEDIITGTLTAGRSYREIERIIGYFVNIFALRDAVTGEMSFKDLLQGVKTTMLGAFDHQDYPFDKLVDQLKVHRDTGRSPVFDIMLVFQDNEELQLKTRLESLEIEIIEKEYVVNKYDLYLEMTKMDRQVRVDFEFRNEIYKKETIRRMVQHYINILTAVTRQPEQLIPALEMISAAEKQQLLIDFNETAGEVPRQRGYHHLFQDRVSRQPQREAARHNNQTITYKELAEQADRTARRLVAHGIQPNCMVALYMRRSIRMLAAIIAVFKAGAAYLPIERDYPPERIRYMLQDAQTPIILTDRDSKPELEELLGQAPQRPLVLCQETADDPEPPALTPGETPEENRYNPEDPEHYAYMIYTSGTTGQPRGVLIHQPGMINHLYAKINGLAIAENDRIAHTASPCFDISVWQFLAALLKGGTTVIFDYEVVLNPEALLQGLQQEKITILETVPSLMNVFLDMIENKEETGMKDLRWMIPTGEALKPALVNRWFKHYPHIKLVNAYGPTEASDDITHYVIDQPGQAGEISVPIGKPVQNMRIYILDKNLSLCPVGIRGEICTAGIGVGKGYWREPQKTARAFIPNPYKRENDSHDYDILYKTGDIGYFREDGNIECLGRGDNQVKIRGFRIELEEIEAVIIKHPSLKDCAVLVKKKTNSPDTIVAFLVKKEPIDTETIKKFILNYLPAYMVPQVFVTREELPLAISGKVDRQALAAEDIETRTRTAQEPPTPAATPTQELIARIWAEALETEPRDISIHDNFFHLGGHSLLIPGIHRKLKKKFPGKCEIADLFEYTTIYELANRIEGTAPEEDDEIIEIEIE